MARTLDFNLIAPPTLPLVMRDADKTRITVCVPSEGMIESLGSLLPELESISNETAADPESIRLIYEATARFISCNREGITVTADDLRGKYKFNFETLVIFYQAYIDFITGITNEKN